MTIYKPGQPWNPGEFASILAIGDSWFWYPKNNLLSAITRHPRLKDPYRNIQMLGYNGAKLHEYVFGKYASEFRREMQPNNSQYYSAVFISGAGNDAVDYHLCLKPDCRNINNAADCLNAVGVDLFLQDLSRSMASLLHDISWSISTQNRTVDVLIHGYDYPIPDGRGFDLLPGISIAGPWLKPALDNAHVLADQKLRNNICKLLIDKVNDLYQKLDGQTGIGYRVHYIDSRNGLSSGKNYNRDWDNELHPTSSGFDKVVEKAWVPKLQLLGYVK